VINEYQEPTEKWVFCYLVFIINIMMIKSWHYKPSR